MENNLSALAFFACFAIFSKAFWLLYFVMHETIYLFGVENTNKGIIKIYLY